MHLAAGTRLGPYEIEALVGAGGMGEVYKARDTRLDRVVALKILSPVLAAHPELRDRFEREARAISNVAHPNICTLFDLGRENATDFLVMEFLEGETLAARLERGALPFEHALSIAIDVISALETAHRRGIVHRDLKPGNVMLVRRTGLSGTPVAKLLDFGLAKLAVEAPAGASVVTSPQPLTQQGAILGTFQYMAPEQLEGAEADERSDIFAFGALFYEMLTGRRAFQGKTQASLIGAILKDAPAPVSSVQPITPAAVERIVARCLAKDPDERWQTASDLAAELRWVQQGGAQLAPSRGRERMRPREISAWILATVALAAGIALAVVAARPAPDQPVVRFGIEEPPEAPFSPAPIAPFPAVSPDGRHIAFMTNRDGVNRIAVRSLDNPAVQMLAATDGATLPFWSTDSRFVGFFAAGKLQRYDFQSATVQPIASVSSFEGGTWNRDGTILFGSNTGGLLRVSAGGGTPAAVTTLDAAKGEFSHRWPVFMPDGRHYVFIATPGNRVFFGSLDGAPAREILATDGKAIFSAGHLIYGVQGLLYARRFNPERGEFLGDAGTIAEDVRMSAQNARGTYSASDTGVIVYRSGALGTQTHLQWYDRVGTAKSEAMPYGDYRSLSLAPDGTRVAFHKHELVDGGGVWIKDLTRGTVSRVTLNNSRHSFNEVWHPDGRQIAFVDASPSSQAPGGAGGGPSNIHMTAASGTGSVEPLVVSDSSKAYPSWSLDGRLLTYQEFKRDTKSDIYVMPMDTRKPEPYIQGAASEMHPAFSPNSKWVAYVSDESGRFEIYVQPYPANGEKWPVSTAGGLQPRWRADGKELFFLSSSYQLMAVDVATDRPRFEAAVPHALFQTRASFLGGVATPFRQFDVTADGQSFIVNETPPTTTLRRDPLMVILNWTSLLRR